MWPKRKGYLCSEELGEKEDWNSLILFVSPSHPLVRVRTLPVLCASVISRAEGPCLLWLMARDQVTMLFSVPSGCGTPFHTQNMPIPESSVVLHGSGLPSALPSRTSSLSVLHLGVPAATQLAQEASA